ncbi:AMP-binding protein [Nocardia sp. CA2R105]|uniref:AMP-binding protein n=1 Tax=Nocardia coffeae TaxID=2873381 RepID=UPI001CA6C6DA|nr:AMP-binding protein [Nocardia coffeae]MBY8856850.1 AMP-binding protein [Nocardia coffeae]
MHQLTVADVVREHRRSRAHVTALVDGEHRFNYAQLDERSNRLANALVAAGVGHGGRVLWLGVNSFRIVELLVACAKIGAVLCPANWRQSSEELRFVLEDLRPAVVVWEAGPLEAALDPIRADAPGRWVCHNGNGPDDYESWLAVHPADDPESPVSEEDPLLLLYTAAFDGHPNGALLAQRALLAHSMMLGAVRQVEEGFVCLDSGPLFHVGTMMFAVTTLVFGGTNVVLPTFDPELACLLIERERCQAAVLFPAMISQLVEANRGRRFDLSSLRFAPADDDWNSMITVDTSPWGRSLAGYGQTEVGGMLTYHALGLNGVGASGRPSLLVQVRLVDPDDHEVPDGEIGEIVARGPHIFSGYFNRPELTTAKLRGGWHHTGDLGRRESDGTISFLGPKLRMIKSGGENIYPAEVERALTGHPDVSGAAVIGRPDPVWGQNVVAVVVLEPGCEVSGDDLIAYTRDRIASYKKPKDVIVVEEIPRRGFTPDYDLLDTRYGGGGYPGGQTNQQG